jgi:hypothetical protein
MIISSVFVFLALSFWQGTANSQDASAVPAKAPEAQSYRAGGKSIVIPPPASDLDEIGADYRVALESFVPETNRLLAGFLHPAEISGIRAGTTKQLSDYALVEIPRRAEFADVDAKLFKQISDGVAQQFGGNLDSTMKDQEEEVNRRLKAMTSTSGTISFDKPVQLGSLFSKQDACGFGMIMPISANGQSTKMAMSLLVMRVQNRVLFAYIYAAYKDEATIQWIRSTGQQWADAILKANRQ